MLQAFADFRHNTGKGGTAFSGYLSTSGFLSHVIVEHF
jgi:hypothetical protein